MAQRIFPSMLTEAEVTLWITVFMSCEDTHFARDEKICKKIEMSLAT